MVTAERERQLAALSDVGNVRSELLGDGADSARLLHLADVGVVLDSREERVDRTLVVLDVPSERLELAEQAGLDEVVGALVDTGAGLAAGEGVREDLGG